MKKSVSWDLVRFKENVFLVDANGNGHYKSLETALRENCIGKSKKGVSLLLQPGKYSLSGLCNLFDNQVDLVGNWEPPRSSNAWPDVDSPIELLSHRKMPETPSIFWLRSSDIFLARISVWEEATASTHGSIIWIQADSRFKLLECSVRSNIQEMPAINQECNTTVIIKKCRFYGGYHPILTVGKTLAGNMEEVSLNIEDSVFSGSKIQAVEVRFGTKVVIKNSHFVDCGSQGLCAMNTKRVNVINCVFDNCGKNKSVDEGAMQLRLSSVEVLDTSIKNQKGHGIVIEGGDGKFTNVDITHCDQSAILTQAPLKIRHCRIKKVKNGLDICQSSPGEIVMEGNQISECVHEIFGRDRNTKKPRMIGDQHKCTILPFSYGAMQGSLPPGFRPNDKRYGKRYVPQHDMDKNPSSACCACGAIIRKDVNIATECDLWFCSAQCFEKLIPFHRTICKTCRR